MIFNFFTSLISALKVLFKEILNLIYKRKCVNCGCSIQDSVLCKSCLKTVENLPFFYHKIINGYRVYSVYYYEGAVKNLIHELKFKHNRECANFIGEILYNYIKETDIDYRNAVIIPVLTHKKNYNKRGYDNVLEFGIKLSCLLDCEINSKVLKKIKYTKPQYLMKKNQRKSNIRGSFELDKNFKTEKLVILLDDIITTGATLEYITSLFKENGIENLVCLTFSKTRF